jgi:RNA polymerase sigma-70 factor, ECF subfamily
VFSLGAQSLIAVTSELLSWVSGYEPGTAVPWPEVDAEQTLLAELVAACARCDDAAFAELYELTVQRVQSRVYRTLRDVAQSEEVTQEVYLELWINAGTYQASRSPVIPYLLMLAHRHAVDRVRRTESARRRDTVYATDSLEREHDQTSEGALDRIDADRVRHRLGQLSGPQQQAIQLAFFGGRSHAEIADELAAPLGTIKSRIRDALGAMRRSFTPLGPKT